MRVFSLRIRRKPNSSGTVCVTRAKATDWIGRRTEERENGVNLVSNRNDVAALATLAAAVVVVDVDNNDFQ